MKFSFFFILLCASLIGAGQSNRIPDRPNPPRLVNDFAEKLIPEQERFLETKLLAYEDSTSTQIAIVLVNTLNGMDASQYAIELGEEWGVGQAKGDNGVVILVSTGEQEQGRRKAFIAVGRGLEPVIPDIIAGRILDQILIPNLQTGNYLQAFDQTTNALFKAAAGEFKGTPGANRRRGSGTGRLIIGIIVLFIILSMFGGRGGRGGGYMSRRGYRGFGGGPIFFPGSFGGSGGGFGSSGGGGGFGGFGGGSFGGGGAGGDW